ncbi:MAG: M28 family metallopeptidase [Gemmatimonadales bacterium]
MQKRLAAAMAAVAVAAGCGGRGETSGGEVVSRPAVPAPATAVLSGDRLLQDIKTLASDEFLGRGPGTEGEERTVAFLEAQFREIGLEPGNPDGTWIQKVPLVGITPDPRTSLVVRKGGATRTLKFKDDVVAWTKHVAPEAAIDNSEMVFVGYGIEAPEYSWDDYKGLDVAGKTLVMLVNDPPIPDPNDAAALDSTVFGGKAMTYYGRWTYKYEQGMKHRAAAVLIVHETGPAGYPFAVVQGKTGEQFDLVTPDKNLGRAPIEGWITLDQAQAIFRMAGQDFDQLKTRAASREFAPVPLGVTASMTIKNTLRTVDSRNVVAKLPGSDPARADEYVIYDAHWDHFGVGDPVDGDSIYNGALDNASGTAALLSLARAFKALPAAPKRSILFLAVTAEEQGLLGSQYYSVTPLYPLAKTAANINIDGLNLAGRTSDVTVIGLGASELDDYIRSAASMQERTIRPDPEPEKGYYYRSDHFNFAKEGVPALYAESGVDYLGKPSDYGLKVREQYVADDYHKPSDEVKPDWVMDGAVEDIKLLLTVGYWVAQADKFPEWRPGSEFRAIREKMLAP